MAVLTKGANGPLPTVTTTVAVTCGPGTGVDIAALLVTASGRVRCDEDLVFFNNPNAEDGAVSYRGGGSGGDVIHVDLARLSTGIDRIVVTASVDADAPGHTFAQVTGLRATLTSAGGEALEFTPPPLTDGETAAILVELYRRGDQWKARAVGQGYAAGLAGIATDFGVTVDDPGPTPAAEAAAAAEPAGPATATPAVSLAKGGDATILLDKSDSGVTVTATLAWEGRRVHHGVDPVDADFDDGGDLDLYALFIPLAEVAGAGGRLRRGLQKGKKAPSGVVYYNNLGSLAEPPFIRLDGDSQAPGAETVRIGRSDVQGYVLLCAYSALFNGTGSFASYRARVTVSDSRNAVTVPLFDDNDTSYWVAIALVDFTAADGVRISQVERYSAARSERRPVLYPDGTFAMDKGPVEFKIGEDYDETGSPSP